MARRLPLDSFPFTRFWLALIGPGVMAAVYFPSRATVFQTLPWLTRIATLHVHALVIVGVCGGLYSAALLAGQRNTSLTMLALLLGVMAPFANTMIIFAMNESYP